MIAYRCLFCAVAFFVASLGLAEKSLAATIVPILDETTEGARNNGLPVNGLFGASQRYQQIWDGILFETDPVLVHAISFRVDGRTGTDFAPTLFADSVAYLSTSSLSSASLGTDFEANHGDDKTLVGQNFTLSGSTSAAATNPFDVTFRFDTPFAYDPAAGALLLDVILPSVPETSQLDAVLGGFRGELPPVIGTSRMYSLSSSESTTGTFEYQYGLVAAFDMTPMVAVPLPPGAFLLGFALVLLGTLNWRHKAAAARA